MNLVVKVFINVLMLTFCLSQLVSAEEKTISKGEELFEQGELDKASEYFSNVITQAPNDSKSHHYRGRIYYEKSDFDKAEDYLLKSVALSPENSNYWLWLGRNYFSQAQNSGVFAAMSKAKKGKKALERSVELDSGNVDALVSLSGFYIGAPGFIGGGTDKAKEVAGLLMQVDEIEAGIVLMEIDVEEAGSIDTASKFKKMAEKINSNPKYARFYNVYGYYLLEQNSNSEAIEQFEKLVMLKPEDPNSHDSLGDGYYSVKRFLDAKKSYQAALNINPDFSLAKDNLKKVNKDIKNLRQ